MIARRWGKGRSFAARQRRHERSDYGGNILWVDLRSGELSDDPPQHERYVSWRPCEMKFAGFERLSPHTFREITTRVWL